MIRHQFLSKVGASGLMVEFANVSKFRIIRYDALGKIGLASVHYVECRNVKLSQMSSRLYLLVV